MGVYAVVCLDLEGRLRNGLTGFDGHVVCPENLFC
jgi:hypothetical protein